MKKGTITYLYDALCGWCYGFSPVIKQLHKDYQDDLNFSVISGGLFVGERIGPINKVASYIRAGAYKSVVERTGVKFGEGFLKHLKTEEDTLTLDSLYPAIALCIVKEQFPEKAVDFAHSLQGAVYDDGIDTIDLSAYTKYAVEIGCDAADFDTKMKSEKYLLKAKIEFDFFQRLKVSGFPALILTIGEKSILISSGYTDYDVLKERLREYGIGN
jgi:putative protein-disulfide isomerase